MNGRGLSRYRWVVERTFAWLHNFKRLFIRYDHRDEIHEAATVGRRARDSVDDAGGYRPLNRGQTLFPLGRVTSVSGRLA